MPRINMDYKICRVIDDEDVEIEISVVGVFYGGELEYWDCDDETVTLTGLEETRIEEALIELFNEGE